jgi:hypothetical protein
MSSLGAISITKWRTCSGIVSDFVMCTHKLTGIPCKELMDQVVEDANDLLAQGWDVPPAA